MSTQQALLIKTSSFGDVIHTFPALSDARACLPGLRFDWVVEPDFAAIAALHPAVERVIPLSMRSLRQPNGARISAWLAALRDLRARRYEAVIDAQGLIKTMPLALLTRGKVHGFDRNSAREGLASLAYDYPHAVARGTHAIARTRALFARSFGYPLPMTAPRFGLDREKLAGGPPRPEIVFVHAASWGTKLWPTESWRELAGLLIARGYRILLPAHGAIESERARQIKNDREEIEILPPMDLASLARRLAKAQGAICLDTGLAHLAAALGLAVITLYGATSPVLTGATGPHAQNIAAPQESCPHLPCLERRCRRLEGNTPPPCLGAISASEAFTRLLALITLP